MHDFEKFCEEIEKDQEQSRGIIYKVGSDGSLPIQYLRILVKIEDAINDTTNLVKEKKLNLNKTNSVQLNKLKQKMKKYVQAAGPASNTLENQINKFREAPVWSDDERKAAKALLKKADESKKAATKKEETKKKAPAKKKDTDESSESEESASEEDKANDEEEDEEDEESYYDEEDEKE